MVSDVGEYDAMVNAMASSIEPPSLSYLSRDWTDTESWRRMARTKVHELMAFAPPSVPLDPTIDSVTTHDNVVIERISYNMPYGPRTEGFFLYPDRIRGRLPTVIVLHDHGGFKYWGKEKVCWVEAEPLLLQRFKEQYYGGRSWTLELARRGFAVLCVDLFMWGSRRVSVMHLSNDLRGRFDGLTEGSEGFVIEYNNFAAEHEHTIAKTMLAAGSTLQGVFTFEDRRSVDYLLTRAEVDPDRIGCGGLSGGGLRTIFLAGLDPRIKCAVCVGFMSTFRELLRDRIKCHTWMTFLPYLSRFMDLPDLIGLGAPNPLMVQCNRADELFTIEGQTRASEKIASIYEKMGHPENYSGRFYDGPHKFDLVMQDEAFKWFERWLKRG